MPTTLHPDPCLVSGPLVFAGDAFATPRVEGAATSGWAAADALLDRRRGSEAKHVDLVALERPVCQY